MIKGPNLADGETTLQSMLTTLIKTLNLIVLTTEDFDYSNTGDGTSQYAADFFNSSPDNTVKTTVYFAYEDGQGNQ